MPSSVASRSRYDRELQRRLAIEHDLRGCGRRQELALLYQPVVALPSGRPVGVEALVRWHHPTLGVIPPAEFIPIAEETGLIGDLGAWVIEHACRQLAAWRDRGTDLWMSVNVSSRELRSPGYLRQVERCLRRHGVQAGQLVLELTESAAAEDCDELARTLRTLRGAGLRIALDDFGSGYSSLSQLRRLDVDILKIDREIVAGGDGQEPLVDVIVALGLRLGLDVICEGIEDEAQRAVVEDAGCELCQGYLFARPLGPAAVEAMVAVEIRTAA
jgi:diguanylate cyclase